MTMEKRVKEMQSVERVTLAEILARSGVENAGLMSDCIAVNSEFVPQTGQPKHLDATVLGVGTEGETTITINLKEYRLRRGTLFIFGPRNIFQMHSNNGFKANLLVVSTELMNSINVDAKRITPLLLQFFAHPCIEISEEEGARLSHFISLVEEVVMAKETPFAREIVCELIAATLYKVGDILDNYLMTHSELNLSPHNRSEEYFWRFMLLLGEHYRRERTVGFYARQLCITSKYLTTLIKRVSGRSVLEWIDNFVIVEAKTLLKYSNMSVQEVAYRLNFPNQSFFGSYFKRVTGLSPSQYKAQE